MFNGLKEVPPNLCRNYISLRKIRLGQLFEKVDIEAFADIPNLDEVDFNVNRISLPGKEMLRVKNPYVKFIM